MWNKNTSANYMLANRRQFPLLIKQKILIVLTDKDMQLLYKRVMRSKFYIYA